MRKRFYSGDISVSGDEILIKSGKIHRVTAGGYDVFNVRMIPAEEGARTPYGRLGSEVIWEKTGISGSRGEISVDWKIMY